MTTPSISTRYSTLTTIGLLSFHLILLCGGLVWATSRLHYQQFIRRPPVPQNEPMVVVPLYNEPSIVSDEQLKDILWKLRPRFRSLQPEINNLDHALRFWGIEATFADDKSLSGVEMRDILTDHRRFAQVWGTETYPLIVETDLGFKIRAKEGKSTASHFDHTLASLLEVGTPLDFPIYTSVGEATVGDLLRSSLSEFRLFQDDYEWSLFDFALCLPGQSWYLENGRYIDFDRMATWLMKYRLTKGVCYGNHRLYTLAAMLQVDEKEPLFSPEKRAEVIAHLKRTTEILIKTQHEEGCWDVNWDGSELSETALSREELSRKVLATGHAMEWWAIAPQEVLPPLEVRVKAGQWLCKTVKDLDEDKIERYYIFLSHVGRSLALWRQMWPHEVIQQAGLAG